MVVYLIRNEVTGLEYVGATEVGLDGRMAKHFYAAFSDEQSHPLYAAMREHGMAAFTYRVLAECGDRHELYARERAEIAERKTLWPGGYNQMAGHGEWWKNRKRGPMSDEQRRKISLAQKGRRAWNTGVPHTYKARLKMRGRKVWNKGVPRTDAEKAKIRASMAASPRHGNHHPNAKAIECDGVVYPSIREMQRATGMSRSGIYYRLAHGKARLTTCEI